MPLSHPIRSKTNSNMFKHTPVLCVSVIGVDLFSGLSSFFILIGQRDYFGFGPSKLNKLKTTLKIRKINTNISLFINTNISLFVRSTSNSYGMSVWTKEKRGSQQETA